MTDEHIETCLTCRADPSCCDKPRRCRYIRKFGYQAKRPTMIQESAGVPEKPIRYNLVALKAAASRTIKSMGISVDPSDIIPN